MRFDRLSLLLNWTLLLGTASAAAYLGVRYFDLEHRYAALAAAAENAASKPGHGAVTGGSSGLEQQISVAQARLAAMRHELDAVQEHLKQLQIAGNSGLSQTGAVKLKKPALSDADIEEANRRQRERNSIQLHDYFQSETVDPEWSKKTNSLIENRLLSFGQEPNHSMFSSSECRNTLCQIEILHEDSSRQAEFELALPMLLGDELPGTMMFSEERPDGAILQRVYLSRKGYDFPLN